MTRILQIRRGTTTQNNQFTGMPGELTFDTTTKVLRVHDGETLGGFELARRDQIGDGTGGGSDFDINSVPAEFWQSIIEQYAPSCDASLSTEDGYPMSIANVAYLEYLFEDATDAKIIQTALICQTPEAGYNIGDEVTAWGIGTRTNPMPNFDYSKDGLVARLMVGGENFWVSHKTNGTTTNITNSKWKIKFTVWY
ncbi:hypothetical protein LJC18_03570 [Lachnospiraceae bacterium OttesenSCG-928-E19]|nr:hypothetical protein [Lachnospiraceae bacterium OttesenSCG-928-E19]